MIDEHTRSEKVELDAVVARRDAQRRRTEGDRAEEEAFMVSEWAYVARLSASRRAAWVEYHRAQVERHRATLADLIAHHEAEAERLVPGTGGGVGS